MTKPMVSCSGGLPNIVEAPVITFLGKTIKEFAKSSESPGGNEAKGPFSMGKRRIEDIDAVDRTDEANTVRQVSTPRTESMMVWVNYPEPTALSLVVRDVAKWSEYNFVMEPSSNAKVQIFAPKRLEKREAYQLFLVALSVVGLRAIQMGQVVKIVPSHMVISA